MDPSLLFCPTDRRTGRSGHCLARTGPRPDFTPATEPHVGNGCLASVWGTSLVHERGHQGEEALGAGTPSEPAAAFPAIKKGSAPGLSLVSLSPPPDSTARLWILAELPDEGLRNSDRRTEKICPGDRPASAPLARVRPGAGGLHILDSLSLSLSWGFK